MHSTWGHVAAAAGVLPSRAAADLLLLLLPCVLQVAEGLNDTAENLMTSIAADEAEVSPSTLYATACILEGCPFINGSPQNTFVPGLIEMAVQHNVLIGGDDFKSGQVNTQPGSLGICDLCSLGVAY
jgi:hypothetical protein